MTKWLPFLVVCFFSFSTARAGDPPLLFTQTTPGGDASPAEAYHGVWSVTINAEELKQPVREITLNLPDQQPVTIRLEHWEPRAGYILEYDDEGNAYSVPDPKAQPEDFSWLWYGRGEGWTVSLTLHQGIVAGRATSADLRYGLEPRPGPITQLGLINSSYWKTHPDERPGNPKRQAALTLEAPPAVPLATTSATSAPARLPGTKGSWDDTCSTALNVAQTNVVDVLVMYTPGYLSYSGSVGQVEAQVQAGLDDANTSLRNSEMFAVRFSLAGVEAVPSGFNYDTNGIVAALDRLSGNTPSISPPYCSFASPNTAVRNRRNAKNADVVALARRDATSPPEQSCGVGWLQRVVYNNGCEMEPGPAWGDTFPYFVFDPQCGADRLNFAHEIGHTLGMEHDPVNSDVGAGGAAPSCPWSFGHRRADTGVAQSYRFRTVMAYWNNATAFSLPGPAACSSSADCQLIDAYSNWNLQWAGPSGIQPLPLLPSSALIGVQTPWISGQPKAHAFDTMQRLGAIVAAYRTRPDAIFADDFQ